MRRCNVRGLVRHSGIGESDAQARVATTPKKRLTYRTSYTWRLKNKKGEEERRDILGQKLNNDY